MAIKGIKKVIYVGELIRTPDPPDHRGIIQGLEESGFDYKIVDPILNSVDIAAQMIIDFNPDLVIHGNTDSLGRHLGSRVKGKITGKQVFWMLDYQPETYCDWNNWIKEDGVYDLLLLSNKDQLKLWSDAFSCPTAYLPHGCVVQDMVRDENHYHKSIFIGSRSFGGWYDARENLLTEINDFEWVNAPDFESRHQIWKDMPAIYHTSDSVIDISHSWTADGYASGRYFYAAGLGGCSITKRFPGCEELYPGDCKAYFDTAEEARNLIEYYHTHLEEREAMKKKAWEHNKKYHNYKLRFQQIIKML